MKHFLRNMTQNVRWIVKFVPICRVRAFNLDRRGIAALEFAMILPVMLILLIGMTEFTNALSLSRQLSQAASAIAHMAAQSEDLTCSEINDLLKSFPIILKPYPSPSQRGGVVVGIVEIEGNKTPKVVLSKSIGTGSAWKKNRSLPAGVPLPQSVRNGVVHMVLVQATYTYSSNFSTLFQKITGASSINFEEFAYERPTVGFQVPNC